MADPYYSGSTLLAPFSASIGLPLDQINFIGCELSALALGYPFRVFLGPHVASPQVRHVFETIIGLSFMIFLFGSQTLFVLAQTLICYILMQVLPKKRMPTILTVVAMTLLSICHIWRQIYNYRTTTVIEISTPLMINTQRVTSLAWSLYDGQVKDKDKLTPNQQRVAVREMPTILEILSYTLSFHTVVIGPFCFYKDYINFIEGTNLHRPTPSHNSNQNHQLPCLTECPSPTDRVLKRFLAFVLCALVAIFLNPLFPREYLSDPGLINSGFLSITLFHLSFTSTTRYSYYGAWKLSEAVNNNAGFGFYYDRDGKSKWDLADNANLLETEFATNIKMFLDNWNISTTHWMRYLVFERVTTMKTQAVFALSSIWHGFYPGYYITTSGALLCVTAARHVRRKVRPWFIGNTRWHRFYDILTIITTRLAISYIGFPFLHLEFGPAWAVYRNLYFYVHILTIFTIVTFTLWPKQEKMSKKVD